MEEEQKSHKRIRGNPNFSVILPGGCNAKCDFCFWKMEKSPDEWLDNLKKVLKKLPDRYRRVTVSGGEPTMSKMLEPTLEALSERHWEAVVLTTNGALLEQRLDLLNKYITNINISRHNVDDKKNEEIFKTSGVPSLEKLREIIPEIHADVNMNCVLLDQFANASEVQNYIETMRDIHRNVRSICFRKDQRYDNTAQPIEMTWFPGATVGSPDPNCPVCLVWVQRLFGLHVSWKASIAEPSIKLDETYELIYNQNGTLTDDWGGKRLIKLTKKSNYQHNLYVPPKSRIISPVISQEISPQIITHANCSATLVNCF